LSLKKFELGQEFESGRIHSMGFCVSGQTVRSAYEKVRQTRRMRKKVIINIGSVDLLHYHSFVRITHDMELLNQELFAKGVDTIIWTTLAPLANQLHEPSSRQKLMDINKFLRYRFANVIDIHQVMVNTSDDKILFACYQPSTRRVSGSTRAHVFWNKIGRQRVLQKIQAGVEALPHYFSSSFNDHSVLI
jgi:maternal effect protein oskar